MTRRAHTARRRFGRSRRDKQRGMALVLVLGALTIMTIMLTEFQDETSAELGSALSERDSVKAEYAAKSAINLARLLIAAEPTVRKSIAPLMMMMNQGAPPAQIPVWVFASQILGAFNDVAGAADFQGLTNVNLSAGKNLGMKGAGFQLKIVDEDSKINVNTAARASTFANVQLGGQLMGLMVGPQYDPLFKTRDARGNFSDRLSICSAIIDWTDLDQETFQCMSPTATTATAQSSAAEDSYYELLKQPYSRKNAAFDSLEELRLVRGVTDDFWSTFVDPDPDNPDKRLLTVWGQGKINVNTANARTIYALICDGEMAPLSPMCADPLEATKFLTVMGMMRGLLAGAPLFGSPQVFMRALEGRLPMLAPLMDAFKLKPVLWKSKDNAAKVMSTESQVFSIYATGYVKAGKRETRVRIHEVVDFRGAPPPGFEKAGLSANLQAMLAGAGGLPGQIPPVLPNSATNQATQTQPGANGLPGNLPPGASSGAIAGALQPTAAGNVVYFRMD